MIFGVGFYALCSSSMLFFNKLSVTNEGPWQPEYQLLPGPISCIQLLFANLFCLFLWVADIEDFEDLRNMHTLKMYSIYCVLFVGKGASCHQRIAHAAPTRSSRANCSLNDGSFAPSRRRSNPNACARIITPAALLLPGSVYASMKALQGSNMETQIVFRSATPIAVAGLEYFFLEREMPSAK